MRELLSRISLALHPGYHICPRTGQAFIQNPSKTPIVA